MRTLRPLLVLFGLLSVMTGIIYPLAVTGIGRLAFANAAAGSLVTRDKEIVGSSLIGQSFADPKYFWGRVSATTPMPNNAAASTGSNLGPTNPALIDLVTASASGLDPHISPAAALYQVARVARVRHLDPVLVRSLVEGHIEGAQWGIFGEARVNVLMLNLALDRAQ
jgi:K+-transporting ATPase ATPase C chain